MNLKDLQKNITEAKNSPFLIGFLNSCKLNIPTIDQNQIPPEIRNTSVFGNNSFYNPNTIAVLSALSPDKTRESLDGPFKEVAYASFFTLMLTQTSFTSSMKGTVDVYSSDNPPNMQLLKTVIDNNMKDTFDRIFTKIQNGERLTLQDVTNEISGGLSKNSKSINDETMLLANAPFKIPQVAIEQRMNGIRWKPISGGSLPLKDIERIRRTTQQIKTTLEQAKTQMQTARSIVQLLRVLETVYAKGYIGILQQVAKKLFSIVRDLGSTGFYFLNMVEPYMLDGLFTSKDLDMGKIKSNATDAEKAKLLEKISRKRIVSDYEYLLNDFKSATPYISNYTIQDFDEIYKKRKAEHDAAEQKKREENSKYDIKSYETGESYLTKILNFYRPTTYASFIRTIADAFLDEADLPTKGKIDMESTSLFNINAAKRGAFAERSGEGDSKPMRTGRPIFGDTSTSMVMVIGFSIPDFINLAYSGGGAIFAIMDFFKGLWSSKSNPWGDKSTKGVDLFQAVADFGDIYPFNFLGGNFADDYKDTQRVLERHGFLKRKKRLYDYYTKPPSVNDKGEIEIPDDNNQYPDFYGVSFRGFFPVFFHWFDEAEAELNQLLKDFKGSLSKTINKLLNNIENLIDDLEDFIDLLDNILKFFEALQTMGLYKLQIISNGGNQDIVEKLLAAEGFPGVEEGDKLRLIGGFVLCTGAPNPDLNGFDFINFIKQKSAMVSYQAQVEKFAVSDDPEDDPGSFADYMFEENIYGFDYNSSSDKIFKKLF